MKEQVNRQPMPTATHSVLIPFLFLFYFFITHIASHSPSIFTQENIQVSWPLTSPSFLYHRPHIPFFSCVYPLPSHLCPRSSLPHLNSPSNPSPISFLTRSAPPYLIPSLWTDSCFHYHYCLCSTSPISFSCHQYAVCISIIIFSPFLFALTVTIIT